MQTDASKMALLAHQIATHRSSVNHWRISFESQLRENMNYGNLEARQLKSMEKYMDDPDMQKVKDVSEDAARSTKKN